MALPLHAVGGLTTREIADAFYIPEAPSGQKEAAPLCDEPHVDRVFAPAWGMPPRSSL